ncbi:LOB domain-containing protein 41-like [Tripterygium wilfordii]|uniref:LOB domain-containing protein 41-like n=2 Tax=Tripterygium wilfordii TaxID=458696 RepID=A0A7J7CKE1_TRIWF|nr:LOB domain-containing protein 41-like [Tripterygium wilfordii]
MNPVYGAAGLMCTGRWIECEAAVKAVMEGKPIKPVSSDAALTGCDIRHVSKEVSSATSDRLREVSKCKGRFKKLAPKAKRIPEGCALLGFVTDSSGFNGSVSGGPSSGVESGEGDSSVSVETLEVFLGMGKTIERAGRGELDLELTLGFGPPV